MSTPPIPTSQRSYPLSPPPYSAAKQAPKKSFSHPQTPQSPSQPYSLSAETTSPTDIGTANLDAALPTPTTSIRSMEFSARSFDMMDSQDTNTQADDPSNKRKRDLEDSGDREQKKVHVEDRRLGIEDLHLDVGKKYLLCRSQHPAAQPDLTHDMFEVFSLDEIASTVARVLPNGEKKGLRKTYKGKLKSLGISGKFDVTAHKEDAPGGLLAMVREPEMEWSVQNKYGREIEKGLPQETRARLGVAMTMAKGAIPKSAWDSSVLGELDIFEKKVVAAPPTAKTSSAPAVSKGVTITSGPHEKGDINRPKRIVKKRSYADSSYEGYGEGYVDDDMIDGGGYSTAEGDERGATQKRRKKNTSGHNYPAPIRHSSYGPGMVGA